MNYARQYAITIRVAKLYASRRPLANIFFVSVRRLYITCEKSTDYLDFHLFKKKSTYYLHCCRWHE